MYPRSHESGQSVSDIPEDLLKKHLEERALLKQQLSMIDSSENTSQRKGAGEQQIK